MKRFQLFIILIISVLLPLKVKSEVPNPVIWKFKTSGVVYASPLIHNDTIFIGSLDSSFYAIDALSGTQLWKFKTKSKINTKASIYEDLICFGSGNYLYVLGLNGSLEFEIKLYDAPAVIQNDDYDFYNSSPKVIDGIAYIGVEKGTVWGYNIKTGEETFKCTTGNNYTVETTPAVYKGNIFFGDWNGVFYSYNLESKAKVWEYDTKKDNVYGGWVNAILTDPVIINDSLYFGGRSCNLYCINSNSGEVIWKYHDPWSMWMVGGPTISDTDIYMGSSYQKFVQSFDKRNGNVNWKTTVGNLNYSNPYADTTFVYVVTGDDMTNVGSVFAIDRKSGNIKSKINADSRVQSSPVLYKGNIYFGTYNGSIYAISKQKFLEPQPQIFLQDYKEIDFGKKASGTYDTSFYVLNKGKADDSITIASSSKYLSVSDSKIFIEAGDSVNVQITLNNTELPKGSYKYNITFKSMYANLEKVVRITKINPLLINSDNMSSCSMDIFPNPVTNNTVVKYKLQENAEVCLSFFGTDGKCRLILEKGIKNKGTHEVLLTKGLLPGIYFCVLNVNGNKLIKEVTVK